MNIAHLTAEQRQHLLEDLLQDARIEVDIPGAQGERIHVRGGRFAYAEVISDHHGIVGVTPARIDVRLHLTGADLVFQEPVRRSW